MKYILTLVIISLITANQTLAQGTFAVATATATSTSTSTNNGNRASSYASASTDSSSGTGATSANAYTNINHQSSSSPSNQRFHYISQTESIQSVATAKDPQTIVTRQITTKDKPSTEIIALDSNTNEPASDQEIETQGKLTKLIPLTDNQSKEINDQKIEIGQLNKLNSSLTYTITALIALFILAIVVLTIFLHKNRVRKTIKY